MLGFTYRESLKSKKNEKILPELDVFGNVISEKNRIEILNLMVKKGAVTIREIEQELGFTATNAYYHIMLMQKAGMLQCGNVGRTIFYSLDKEYFEKLEKMIKKYTK